MPDWILSNPLDEYTCEYCLSKVGMSEVAIKETEELPPFERCTNEDGCRCFYAIEKEI